VGKNKNKKTEKIRLSYEIAAMIDRRLKQWSLKSRSEVIEQVLGWCVQPSDTKMDSCRITELL